MAGTEGTQLILCITVASKFSFLLQAGQNQYDASSGEDFELTNKKQTSKRIEKQYTSHESDVQETTSNVVEFDDHVIVNPVIEDVCFSEKNDGTDVVWRWEKSDLPVMEEPKIPSLKSNLLENGVGELPVDYLLYMFSH